MLAILVIVFTSCTYMNTEDITAAKVSDKERIESDDGSFYLIFTDQGTFSVKDVLIRGNFNSSDWWGSVEKDSCYSFATSGYRIGFFSQYKNIYTEPISCSCP